MIIVLAAALVVLAGLFSAADAALTSFSRARAEELQAEGQAGRAPARHDAGRPGAAT